MFVDLVVLVISIVGLMLTPGRSSLWKLLFKDGIIFFVVAFLCNALQASLLLLNLNPAMNLMFSIPAACLTAGAAARSYIRLSNWSNTDVYVQYVSLILTIYPHLTPMFSNNSNSGRGAAGRKGADGAGNVPTTMSAVNWSRPRTNGLTDIELGTGFPRSEDDLSNDDEFKGATRTVGFERPAPKGVMITMDTYTK